MSSLRPLIMMYSHFDVSGIQTQMLLLANAYVSLGGEVMICSTKGGLETLLDPRVEFFEPDNYQNWPDELAPCIASKITNCIIWASHPFELYRLYRLRRLLQKQGVRAAPICGVFHPRASFKPEDSRLTELICRTSFLIAASNEIYFLNDASRLSHEQRWQIDLSRFVTFSSIMERKTQISQYDQSQLTIVSIGRLVAWKAYNLGLIPICNTLREHGIPFIWHVYGDGPLRPELEATIEHEGLEKHLILHGPLPFEQIESSLQGAHLFVGMGTSMLEAALMRIAAIVAVDSQENGTYGYLHDLPLGNIGEIEPTLQMRRIDEQIIAFHALPEHEKREVAERCFAAADQQTLSPEQAALKLNEHALAQRVTIKHLLLEWIGLSYEQLKKLKKRLS